MPQEGDVVSQYRLLRKIGEGGMGAVYEAVHTRIRSKRAAVKVLHHRFANDPSTIARFEREAEAAAAIGHEGIIDIYDLGQAADGSPYMVMEYLAGESLKDTMKRVFSQRAGASLDTGFTVFLACNVLSALAAAHREGIVHRDLKPDNIFLVETGAAYPMVKLLDFGIARMMELGGSDPSDFTLTKTGAIIGTPYFMSPEQAMGLKDQIDQRSDIWSLGVVLYACATGRFPFEGENYNQLVARLVSDYEPAEPSVINPSLPPALEQVILRAMCKKLELRYASADEMLDELVSLADDTTLNMLAFSERRSGSQTMLQPPAKGSITGSKPSLPQTQITPGGSLLLATTPARAPLAATTPAAPGLKRTNFSGSPLMATTPVGRPYGPMMGTGASAEPAKRRVWPLALVIGVVLLLALVGGLAALAGSSGSEGSPEPASTTPSVAQPLPAWAAPTKTIPATDVPNVGVEAEREGDDPPTAQPVEPTPPVADEPPPEQPIETPTKRRHSDTPRHPSPGLRVDLPAPPPPRLPRPPSSYGTKIPSPPQGSPQSGYGTKL
jgi:serine/threonine-protein kinase